MVFHKLVLVAIVSAFGLVGCEANDGPVENAGETLDEAGEETANAVEEACEETKEGVDAEDTDC